jgi:hypothetical protein
MSQEFAEATKQSALQVAQGRCQCTRTTHDHKGRCPRTFKKTADARFRLKDAEGIPSVVNCEVLCPDCYAKAT